MSKDKEIKGCLGVLYYSTALADKEKKPICVGFPYVRDVTRQQGSRLRPSPDAVEAIGNGEFKYSCVGYGVYKQCMGGSKTHPTSSTAHADVPHCHGLEVIATTVNVDERGKHVKPATPLPTPQLAQDAAASQRPDAPPIAAPAARSAAPPPASSPTFTAAAFLNDFSDKFFRSSTKIIVRMEKNAYKLASKMGSGFEYVGGMVRGEDK
mmetsp:Transcript_39085/g.85049  ORF Transcript_39085/g.85049 Transcript_39085/m.85049 type:complete len:209 (-) Transcript_39085:338-964(-)|eukprot:CAMPEP_0118922394 /NCGR_PEP_ID=MMETSP1169-20130426/1338_1 /TAXON_ID=36882 /ORGANISM="Pyramimonas obovata, Strain CCMP722" /LENGTH=208 /DNA_ID=CAMNT_0006863253 /DNA_START=243 /DNA_END=869 /DNA_ORIENTATION=-